MADQSPDWRAVLDALEESYRGALRVRELRPAWGEVPEDELPEVIERTTRVRAILDDLRFKCARGDVGALQGTLEIERFVEGRGTPAQHLRVAVGFLLACLDVDTDRATTILRTESPFPLQSIASVAIMIATEFAGRDREELREWLELLAIGAAGEE